MMLVSDEIITELEKLFLDVSMETAYEAHKFIERHPHITGFGKTARKASLFPEDDPEYEEFHNSIPFMKYEIPRYHSTSFRDDAIDYNAIFWSFYNDNVDCRTLNGFEKLSSFVSNNTEVAEILTRGKKDADIAWELKRFVSSAVERYLFVSNATATPPENLTTELKKIISEKIAYFFSKRRYNCILVPICLVSFSEDLIEIADNIKIVRMDEEIQKSRQFNCVYEVNKEDWVAACATHMLVLENYFYENSKDFYISSVAGNVLAYPLEVIDDIFAAIRIVTGFTVGYEQILTSPIGWIDTFSCNYLPLYGAKAHAVNPHEIEKYWMHLPVSLIDSDNSRNIQRIYTSIVSTKKDRRGVEFALKRYNRCLLRNDEDDTLVDAAIGIEALLSGGTKNEITQTISSRIPVVFAHVHTNTYTPENSRKIMKRVYSFRSKLVHGDVIKDKDKNIELNGAKHSVVNVAVDFLRYTLLFLLENPEYIDCQNIDLYIDKAISTSIT